MDIDSKFSNAGTYNKEVFVVLLILERWEWKGNLTGGAIERQSRVPRSRSRLVRKARGKLKFIKA